MRELAMRAVHPAPFLDQIEDRLLLAGQQPVNGIANRPAVLQTPGLAQPLTPPVRTDVGEVEHLARPGVRPPTTAIPSWRCFRGLATRLSVRGELSWRSASPSGRRARRLGCGWGSIRVRRRCGTVTSSGWTSTNKGLGRAPEYEHDHRREPEHPRTAPPAAHHQRRTQPDDGHQPLPLDTRSSIWATNEQSGTVGAGRSQRHDLDRQRSAVGMIGSVGGRARGRCRTSSLPPSAAVGSGTAAAVGLAAFWLSSRWLSGAYCR